jgi:hypothetical protein
MIDLGVRALETAVQAAQNYIKKAEEYSLQDVQRVQNYLQAAHVAITGLEREYDQILVQAKYCQLDQQDQVRELNTRIDNYLTVDKLRPELLKAVTGLSSCRVELQKHADRFLQWPWRRVDRREAVTLFVGLLHELEQYVLKLEEQGLQYRPAGTGVAVASLMEIKRVLNAGKLSYGQKPESLVQVVSTIQEDRSKDHLLDFTVKIQQTIDELITAFR